MGHFKDFSPDPFYARRKIDGGVLYAAKQNYSVLGKFQFYYQYLLEGLGSVFCNIFRFLDCKYIEGFERNQ
jgi:hypothetical protein